MTKEEFAKMLDGRDYDNEITKDEEIIAEKNGLVVVFGGSDDLMEFIGAIYNEIDCYEGVTAYLTPKGLFKHKCESDSCPYEEESKDKCKTINALWCNERGCSWTYETKIQHASFDIFDECGEKYCRGIVFSIEDLK